MQFIRSTLSTIGWQGLTRLAVAATVFIASVVAVVTTPATIPARWGSVIGSLAMLGVGTLLSIPASWVQSRFTISMPSWSPRTWSAGRRWYGPGQRVRVGETEAGVALDWTEDDIYGAGIWVLVVSWPKGAPFNETTVAWRPLTALTPHLFPRMATYVGNGTTGA